MSQLVSIVLFLILGSCKAQFPTKFRVENNRILDSSNRECIFHGLNVVYKSPPYLPITDHFDANLSFSQQDMQLLNSLGQNVIRLGVMWPGVSPQKNTINTTYINNVISLISKAYNSYNITSLIDCHQDTLSEAFCGEGAPIWGTQPTDWNFPEPLTSTPYATNNDHIPSKQDCSKYIWWDYLQTYATSSTFQRIYQNYNNLRDAFANHWGVVATNLKSISGVLGFELLNEPWPGDIYNDSELLNPGIADKKNLQPFYDGIVPLIYGNDSDRLVFFESAWYNVDNIKIEVGFDHVPGGEQYANRSVLTIHYYDPPIKDQQQYFINRSADAVLLNSTTFLSEFGISSDMNTMGTTMDYCDENLISWTGWEYKPFAGSLPNGTCTGCGYGVFHKDGSMNENVVKGISRSYAQRVAGHIKTMMFNRRNAEFKLVYDIDTNIKHPTIIYVSLKYWYPNGYNLNIEPNKNVVTYKSYGNFIEIYNSNDIKYNGQTVTVTVQAK